MSRINLLTVDGVVLPNPSKYDISYKDLDSSDSYTSDTGILVRYMIRGNHRTISCEWTCINLTKLNTILRAVSSTESSGGAITLKPHFQLRYYDYMSMDFKTGKFYSSDRNTSALKIRSTTDGRFNISFDFIQY